MTARKKEKTHLPRIPGPARQSAPGGLDKGNRKPIVRRNEVVHRPNGQSEAKSKLRIFQRMVEQAWRMKWVPCWVALQAVLSRTLCWK